MPGEGGPGGVPGARGPQDAKIWPVVQPGGVGEAVAMPGGVGGRAGKPRPPGGLGGPGALAAVWRDSTRPAPNSQVTLVETATPAKESAKNAVGRGNDMAIAIDWLVVADTFDVLKTLNSTGRSVSRKDILDFKSYRGCLDQIAIPFCYKPNGIVQFCHVCFVNHFGLLNHFFVGCGVKRH